MSTNIRKWLIARRDALIEERDRIPDRIAHLNTLIAEIDATTSVAVMEVFAKPAPPRKPPAQRNGKVSTTDLVSMALADAAPAGLTGREVAAVTALPIGTATSRASIMARDGRVRYDANAHRYFALHSTREDNNVAQS